MSYAGLTQGRARLGFLARMCSAGLGVAGRKCQEWVLQVGCGSQRPGAAHKQEGYSKRSQAGNKL